MKARRRARALLVSLVSFAALAPLACGPAVEPVGPARPIGSASANATASSIADGTEAEPVPTVRLPADVRPTAQSIELKIAASEERFSGVAEIAIELGRARRILWLHGRGLHVSRATITPEGSAAIDATWEEKHPSGIAQLTATRAIPAGRAKVRIEYDAPLATSLKGLYRAKQAGEAYAFTQFEAIGARQAFPCFDEPSFKIPFTIAIVVPSAHVAVANTKEAAPPTVDGASKRFTFAPTLPIPSYLVAFATGPLDIVPVADVAANGVRKRPLALRGVAAKGRGPEMAYALSHTGEILTKLEEYFGVEYPYDKLDILAVPDKEGAMENPGAITFREYLVLMNDKAPIGQRRAFAGVMAHELAHMWFGDLVTMTWWDDLWLNESFATWMGNKAADLWDPKLKMDHSLLGGVQGAMGADSLVSARAIRQPILSTHDIENAFDTITYQKGGGVLSMFERWLGGDVVRKGVHDYLEAHRFGSANADDFLGALSTAAGKDVRAPFKTFLDQAGVPFVEVEVKCGGDTKLHAKQSRYFPIGSTGDATRTWQIPICARFKIGKDTKEACGLLTDREGDISLGTAVCPDWVFPNASAAGYFRFSLAPADLAKLRTSGLADLTTRERIAFGNSVRAAYNRATLSYADALAATAPLAGDASSQVAGEPMGFVSSAREWFWSDATLRGNAEAYGRSLYAKAFHRLGWTPAKGEDDDVMRLRQSVISFLAFTARDPAVRAEAKKRGLAFLGTDGNVHRDAVDANLSGIAVSVAGEEADAKLFDSMIARLAATTDEELRGKLLWAIGSARDAALALRAREMSLDASLRVNEVMTTIWAQLDSPLTRDATWQWVLSHYDPLVARISSHHGGARLIGTAGHFCDEARATEVEAFFAKVIDRIDGGPRVLAGALESIRLCAARKKAHEESARAFFAKRR